MDGFWQCWTRARYADAQGADEGHKAMQREGCRAGLLGNKILCSSQRLDALRDTGPPDMRRI